MNKFIFFCVLFFVASNVSSKEFDCNGKDYNCLIKDARYKIYHGQREEGISVLTPIMGPSIESRRILAVHLFSEKKGDNIVNIKKARLLLESAFREGDMDAGNILLAFYYGRKVDRNIFPENDEKAIFILKKILDQKENSTGELDTLLGELLIKNDKEDEGIYWLEKAVNRGYLFAATDLVPVYSIGKHRDIIQAWFYSDLRGTSMASEKSELEKQMTPEQLDQAQQMSWDWQDAHQIRMPGYRSQGSPIQWQVN